jgi:hypothetical protein
MLVLALFLPAMLALPGCEESESVNLRRDYYKSSYMLAGSIEAVTTLRTAGRLTPEQIEEIDSAIDLAQAYRLQWRAALDVNEAPTATITTGLRQIIDSLIEVKLAQEGK